MSIKQRCYYKKSISYKNYGAKGVEMCPAWRNSFLSFLADVGEPPAGDYVLSRKGDSGNYEPGNCEWKIRALNTSERVPAKGEKVHTAKLCSTTIKDIRNLRQQGKTYRYIADKFGVHPTTISRILKGATWSHVV